MNSFKKLYLMGFTFVLIIMVSIIAIVMGIYNSSKNNSEHEDTAYQPILLHDTIIHERSVEKIIKDTVKIYIPAKPKVEKKDTSTVLPSSSSNQSQI